MQEEYSSLKEQNYQLKNEISELKNAFDLNRDILKIVSQESKSTQPRIQMLYQIINRLTSINNQIMINTAQLIQQRNVHKFEKQSLRKQNEQLKERMDEIVEKSDQINKEIKINQLSLYFKTKVNELQQEMKALQEERVIKDHQIQFLMKKLQYYQTEQSKLSLIPTIDKSQLNKKLIPPPPVTLLPQTQHIRKHITNKQTRLQAKLQILSKEMNKLKIYTQEIEYRLLTLIKVMDLQDDIKKKEKTVQTEKKLRRQCLQGTYDKEMVEVRLLKFALNNLVKDQQEGNKDYLFTLTNRNLNQVKMDLNENNSRNRQHYLHKSVEKENKVKMKPTLVSENTQEDQISN